MRLYTTEGRKFVGENMYSVDKVLFFTEIIWSR